MQIIEQNFKILRWPQDAVAQIEEAARNCYKSEDKAGPGSGEKLVKKLKDSGHHAMIEFADATVSITTDRAVSHELVRHRMASFAQESQRYVNYLNKPIKFVKPTWANTNPEAYKVWESAMNQAAETYAELVHFCGMPAQSARTVLPNSTATTIIIKANLREWMHIFKLRTSPAAYPQIRQLMLAVQAEFSKRLPVLFGQASFDYDDTSVTYMEGPHD